jgi:hypothetical protein
MPPPPRARAPPRRAGAQPAGSRQRHRRDAAPPAGARERVGRADLARAELLEQRRHAVVVRGGRERQSLDRIESAPARVVEHQQRVAPQAARVALAVAPQAGVQRLGAAERRHDRVREPLGRLERPAAADAPQRVDRERGVADQREPGHGRPAQAVLHVELAQHRLHQLGVADRRRVGLVGEELDEHPLRVALELRQPRLRRHRGVERQPVVGREGGGPLRVGHPQRRVGRVRRRRPREVAAVGDPLVARAPLRHAPQLGDPRVAPVGADDKLAAQRRLAAVATVDDDARHGAGLVAHQRSRGAAGEQLDARRPRRLPAQQRVELLAPQVEARVTRVARRHDPAPLRPDAQMRAHASGGERVLQQPKPLDHGHPGGLDVVRADPLEGGRIGLLLDERDARAAARQQDRGRAAGEAGADDHGVVVRPSGDDPVRMVRVLHLDPLRRGRWHDSSSRTIRGAS